MAEEIVPVMKFKAACLALLDKVKSTRRPILVLTKPSTSGGGPG